MFTAKRFQLSSKLHDFFVGKQPSLQDLQDLHRFGVLVRVGVGVGQIKEPHNALIFLLQQLLQNRARAIQLPGLQQRIGKRIQERHVVFRRRKRLQQRGSLPSSTVLQLGLGIKQRHTALMRRQRICPRQQLQSLRRRAGSCGELRGTQKRARGQRILSQLRRNLRHLHLPGKLLWVQLRGAFPAEQRIFAAPRFREHLRRLGVLLDGLFPAILLLQQEGVARDAFGGLNRQRVPQEAVINRQRLGLVLGIDQQVEQVAVIYSGAIGLLHTRI